MPSTIDRDVLLRRLKPPAGPVSMVLDTDTYNEIDDQFAVVYALLSPTSCTVEAVYAAPFFNSRSSGPGDGMEKSYEEIVRLLDAHGATDPSSVLPRLDALPDRPRHARATAPAAEDLIARAMRRARRRCTCSPSARSPTWPRPS